MVLWSTYFAVGTCAGMLIAAPFAGTELWRAAFLVQGMAAAVLGIATWQLPSPQRQRGSAHSGLSALVDVLKEIDVVRLAVAFAAITIAGLGANVALPQYLADAHKISVSAAATIVALLNALSVLGGALVGVMLARHLATWLVAALLCAGAVLSATVLFRPQSSMPLTVCALLIWQLMVSGGLIALVMALLPRRLANPAVTGMANGLLVQVSCAAAAVAPPIFLAILAGHVWWNFVVLAWACVAVAFVALPLADRASTASADPPDEPWLAKSR